MKILLLICLCALVVVSGKNELKSARFKEVVTSPIPPSWHPLNSWSEQDWPKYWLIPVSILLDKFHNAVERTVTSPTTTTPTTTTTTRHVHFERALNKNLKKSKKHQNRYFLKELQSCLDALDIKFSLWVESFEDTPYELKTEALGLFGDLFINWESQIWNQNENARHHKTRAYIARQENATNELLTSLKDFLSTLLDYIRSCDGQVTECLKHLVELMKAQQEKHVAKKRYGADHNYLLEALNELANRLKVISLSGDSSHDDVLLLAEAINHLFEDVNILISDPPSVDTNALVIIDIYNVLSFLDSCKQSQQCCNDWWNGVYGF